MSVERHDCDPATHIKKSVPACKWHWREERKAELLPPQVLSDGWQGLVSYVNETGSTVYNLSFSSLLGRSRRRSVTQEEKKRRPRELKWWMSIALIFNVRVFRLSSTSPTAAAAAIEWCRLIYWGSSGRQLTLMMALCLKKKSHSEKESGCVSKTRTYVSVTGGWTRCIAVCTGRVYWRLLVVRERKRKLALLSVTRIFLMVDPILIYVTCCVALTDVLLRSRLSLPHSRPINCSRDASSRRVYSIWHGKRL